MKLYRYMSFKRLRDLRETVIGSGFAAQSASRFDDAFEGVAGIRMDGIQIPAQFSPSALCQHYSVLCFNKADETEPYHEMLMWSLYADKNSGVRVVLDLPWSDFFATSYAVMDNVQYDENILALPLDSFQPYISRCNAIDHVKRIAPLYFVKHPCWAWEKEYRVVIENTEIPEIITLSKPKRTKKRGKKKRYCATFLKEYIVGVDFGLNLWRDQQPDVRKFMADIRKVRDDLTFRKPVCLLGRKSFSFEVID